MKEAGHGSLHAGEVANTQVRSDDAYAQCEGPDGSVDCLERDFPGANPHAAGSMRNPPS